MYLSSFTYKLNEDNKTISEEFILCSKAIFLNEFV